MSRWDYYGNYTLPVPIEVKGGVKSQEQTGSIRTKLVGETLDIRSRKFQHWGQAPTEGGLTPVVVR